MSERIPMTGDDGVDEERDGVLRRAVRAASGPAADPSAAARIADGAWAAFAAGSGAHEDATVSARAADGGGRDGTPAFAAAGAVPTSASAPASSAGGAVPVPALAADGPLPMTASAAGVPVLPPSRPISRLLRPAWMAAAAAGFVAAVVAPRFAPAALAVEGDPVRMWEGDGWTSTRRIPACAWVYAPAGRRALRGPGGTTVRPDPGSLFRILVQDGSLGIVATGIEVLRGRVDLEGREVTASGGAMVVEGEPGPAAAAFTFTMGDPGDAGSVPTVEPVTWLGDSLLEPRVAVRSGFVRVRLFSMTGDLQLGASGEASTVSLADGGGRRLAVKHPFDVSLMAGILAGNPVVEARGDGPQTLALFVGAPGPNLYRVDLHGESIPGSLRAVNEAMYMLATRLDVGSAMNPGPRIEMKARVKMAPTPVQDWTHRKDGRETRVTRRADGSVLLSEAGAETVYPCFQVLHAARPELASRFQGELPASE